MFGNKSKMILAKRLYLKTPLRNLNIFGYCQDCSLYCLFFWIYAIFYRVCFYIVNSKQLQIFPNKHSIIFEIQSFLSIFLKFTKKNAYICTINNCKINSATLITIYTNLVKTKILRILDLSVYFFTKLQKKKNHSKINIASILR